MKSKKMVVFFFSSIVILISLIGLFSGNLLSDINQKQSYAIEERLLQFKPIIEKELEKYNLGDKTTTLLGIIYQESRGEGTDPMQSSESLELKRNEIQDVNLSIEQGVKHFAQMYQYGIEKDVGMDTIIQSYNMGPKYIEFIAGQQIKKHSEKLAKEFSKMKVDQNPDLYTCGDNKKNFRYPYCYGDFTYATKVKEKTKLIEDFLQKDLAYDND
ncbi:lysozyme-like protein [Bacillus thuringiensis]|uniref:Lysozyme-like protein n=1 Tax=Bacillus thuringiensis TaxID=1428 RepID=A0A4R4AW99_BACTU|nr:lysozyme family protein [Bacillus thuringiensis]TCW43975.1 lysozyme-like protein [Bacillus thuringiensis]TCW44600.1 lysozyme-like protein [Bacillus thuringiensis]